MLLRIGWRGGCRYCVQNKPIRLPNKQFARKSSSSTTSSSSPSSSPSPINGNKGKGPVTFLTLGLVGILGSCVLIYYNIEKERVMTPIPSVVTTHGKPALGGPWVMVDQDGVPRTDASYKGQFALLYFGFSFCPDICPSEMVKIGKVMDELTKRSKDGKSRVKPIFISVDPSRDSVEQLRFFGQDFHPDFAYLTGTREQVAKAARAYRIYFSKANEKDDDEDDYLVDHSIVIYLVSPDGEFLEFFTQKTQVKDIVSKIQSFTNEQVNLV